MKIIKAVPTNVITGFLGVGKTTAINHLLTHKPKNERWAVLINEFGEIGVDASLLGQASSEKNGIFMKEVAGGCMCCTSGLPMQIALNRLLQEAKPHRLLIEPTGLGHPKEVLETLTQPHYQSVLDVQATICLLDARNLNQPRYTENETFNEQLGVADIIVANKSDLYHDSDRQLFSKYCQSFAVQQFFVENAQLEWQWLTYKSHFHAHQPAPSMLMKQSVFDADLSPDNHEAMHSNEYIVKENEQGGFYSIGWRFGADFIFNRVALSVLLMGIERERLKAVFITDEGIFGYNKTSYGLSETILDDAMDSRMEVIATDDMNDDKGQWQAQLLACGTL